MERGEKTSAGPRWECKDAKFVYAIEIRLLDCHKGREKNRQEK